MDTQFAENEITDPWLTSHVINLDDPIKKFEDNFNAQFYAKLPDSDEYLAILERKLKKIKNNPDVLSQLTEKREACMQELLSRDNHLEQEHIDFENSTASVLLKTIAPHKQALNQSELLKLVKNDHLEIAETNQGNNLITEASEDKKDI